MTKRMKAALLTGGLFFILLTGWLQLDELYSTNKVPPSFEVMAYLDKNDFRTLPGIEFKDLDQNSIDVAGYAKGKVVILNFWASWCAPCAEEFPSMLKLIDEFKGDVVILAPSQDSTREEIDTFATAFNLRGNPNLTLLWDKDKSLARAFHVNKLPESYVFDRAGRLTKKVLNSRDWATEDARLYFKMLTQQQDQ